MIYTEGEMNMALEDAKKFTKMLLEDEELRGRFTNMSIEEGLSAAKDMGLDFTLEELKEARDTNELTLDDMDKVSSGDVSAGTAGAMIGATSGAATGGLVGFVFGPIGGAIGATVGGVIGGVYGAIVGSSED